MQLNIPPHETEKLAQHATAAGFASVEKYVTQFVSAGFNEPTNV